MKEQFVAEYLRLSMEDGDVVSDSDKEESDSIRHQRELITRHLYEGNLYPDIQILEFVDDGYSGTNFERPAVKRMLSMVREGKICCIIVKDISRFGRNYLEVGDYLEQILPFMGVRFIAVGDGYDSNDYEGTTGGIEIAFRSFLYDLYSKDLSVKVRSALEIRRKRGDFIGPRPPFGYRFSENKKVLAVDEVAAKYVKRVFELACKGYSTGRIAVKLNEEKIPTPGQYKNREKTQYHLLNGEGYWNRNMVLKILENKVYLGIVVNGKCKVTKAGGKQFKRGADEEQVCVSGRHEAIITEQEFLEASEVIKFRGCQRGKEHKEKQGGILLGKLLCGNCKRSLNRIVCTKVPCFICGRARYDKGSGCFDGRLKEPEAEEAVLTNIRRRLEEKCKEQSGRAESDKERGMWERSGGSLKPGGVQTKSKGALLEKKLDALKIEKQYLYEQLKMKKLEKDDYLHKMEDLRAEEQRIGEEIRKMEEERIREEEGREGEIGKQELGEMKLSRELVEEMIEAVYVWGEGEVEVVWKENMKNSKIC
ncbi:hypothetical protein IMSAGC009_01523 [Lachnospiraceae bacterium]|nr:hypothetical protein IMSAGC009_01523 [Lachnospiraceae bacterium]